MLFGFTIAVLYRKENRLHFHKNFPEIRGKNAQIIKSFIYNGDYLFQIDLFKAVNDDIRL